MGEKVIPSGRKLERIKAHVVQNLPAIARYLRINGLAESQTVQSTRRTDSPSKMTVLNFSLFNEGHTVKIRDNESLSFDDPQLEAPVYDFLNRLIEPASHFLRLDPASKTLGRHHFGTANGSTPTINLDNVGEMLGLCCRVNQTLRR
ncbi:MAG: hypothetical protein FJX22_00960 [Alphaproteobacteria bacterium]|nr:hypothetical protein [Alphaproteobacteria bacterium]